MPRAGEERLAEDDAEQAYGVTRLLALSDGIFAFALTLLVVQLAIPDVPDRQLGQQLLNQGPSYVSYALSFGVIALYWYQHHRIFRYVRRWDPLLIVLNLGAMLFIAVMPFPTAILGRYGSTTLAVVIYAGVNGTTGTLTWLLWQHAIRSRLITPSLDRKSANLLAWRAFLTPAVFFLSIPLAFWVPWVAEVSWNLIWISIFVLGRIAGRHSLAREAATHQPR